MWSRPYSYWMEAMERICWINECFNNCISDNGKDIHYGRDYAIEVLYCLINNHVNTKYINVKSTYQMDISY